MHDSHVHLSLSPIKENLKRILADFKEDNGKYILDMGTEPSDWTNVLGLRSSNHYSDTILTGIGIHPTIFDENLPHLKNGIDLFKFATKLLKKLETTYEENSQLIDAVGETGLDYYQMFNKEVTEDQRKDLKEVQERSFRQHCQIAMKYNLPMSIHARELLGRDDCVNDTLKIIAEEGRGKIKGVFHSYTGTEEGLKKVLDMGFYIGFNAIITYPSGENVRSLLKETPLERILFETDGPFLPTQKIRKNSKAIFPFGKPTDVREIIQIAAEIKGISAERLEDESDKNFELVFGNSLN
jgi:TatD DNase family protein